MNRPSHLHFRYFPVAWRLSLGLGIAVTMAHEAVGAPPSLFAGFGGRKQEKATDDGGKDGRRFSKNREFILPFNLTDSEKAQVAQVHLFVRTPGEAWRKHDSLDPSAGKFRFMVPADGEYWFNIVTADKQGRMNPSDTTNMPSALRVVVDTQAPLVELAPKQAGNELHAHLVCDDRHLDKGSIKVEIQEAGKAWREIQPIAGHPFQYPVPAGEACRLRAQAADLAGNIGTGELSIGNPPPSTPSVAPSSMPVLAQAANLVPAAPVPPQAKTAQALPRLVNSTRTTLDYKIEGVGPSGVGKVEIWITGDGGKTWNRKSEDPDMISPAVVELPGEGVHGLIVHAVNGSGGGDPPPGPNTPPDIVLEVDSTRPTARIVGLKPSPSEAVGAIDIAYEVADKNLGPQPVTLLVASRKGGPWTPLAQRVANTGTYRWDVPQHAGFEFHFRIEAIDMAGNIGAAETDQAVRFDTSRPKAKVIQVRTEPAESAGQVVPATTGPAPSNIPQQQPEEAPKMIDLPGSVPAPVPIKPLR